MMKNLCQRMFGRSLWVYHANSGGCNGCDIEVLNVLTPYYDVERFGIKLVGSPRHADVMLCQGPAMRSTAKALRRAYDAMPAPKLVFAIGSCACGGGIWHDTYAVLGPRREGRARRLLHPRMPTAPGSHHLRCRGRPRAGRQEGCPDRDPSTGTPRSRATTPRRSRRRGPSPRLHQSRAIVAPTAVPFGLARTRAR